MIFNSFEFLLFFIIFFFLYWFVFNKTVKLQNIFVLVASYFFYACWDWRFLSILIISSAINFYIGIQIGKIENERKRDKLLYIGLFFGLLALFYFKYFNFFIESFIQAFAVFSINLNITTIKLLLPLGISFYTFRTLSYVLDVYNEEIKPTTDIVVFFSYIAFFPTLLSGPIDKARDFIPQLEKKRKFDYNLSTDGLRQILWGLFKKIVIADNAATYVNQIFANYNDYSGIVLVLGAFLFLIQLYGDFSGYSDMAIGFSKLIGFKVTKNFNFPLFSQSIAEFWRKWHISLTTWMTEYVFIPLSFTFRKFETKGLFLSILINFLLIGLWHGANWTYVIFGLLQGIFFLPLILTGKMNKNNDRNALFPSFRELVNMLSTFTLVVFAFVLLRATSLTEAIGYYKRILTTNLFEGFILDLKKLSVGADIIYLVLIIFIFLFVEWIRKNKDHVLQIENTKSKKYLRWTLYYFIGFLIVWFAGKTQIYIYSQF